MRYGIFSDVHSNLEALEAILDAIEAERVDQLLCAGDWVGYGADPTACLAILRQRGVLSVCGNHDAAVAGQMDLDWFNPYARAALEWTSTQLSEGDRSYLRNLPLVWTDARLTLVHSSLHEPREFHYILNLSDAQASLRLQTTPVLFVGHTHSPGIFVQEGERVSFQRIWPLRIEPQRRYLVNVGSVGQPRDGDPRAAWCLYDSEEKALEVRRVPYPMERAQSKIQQAGLPGFLADRLAIGY